MRDREIERLTEVFKDAILHAPIPDVNPNLIRTVESQARECALRVVGDALAPAEQEGPRCRDCGAPWMPVRRSECLRCGSDAGQTPAPSVRPDTKAAL